MAILARPLRKRDAPIIDQEMIVARRHINALGAIGSPSSGVTTATPVLRFRRTSASMLPSPVCCTMKIEARQIGRQVLEQRATSLYSTRRTAHHNGIPFG